MQMTQERPVHTARSWDSFKDTMYAVLDEFKPKACFEWGPGTSTQIMLLHPEVETLDSVEHNSGWHKKWSRLIHSDKWNLFLENEEGYYANKRGNHAPYDFIFIDGEARERCLTNAIHILKPDGIVMLHDAERPNYKSVISLFEHNFYTDLGSTVTLTNSEETYSKFEKILDDL